MEERLIRLRGMLLRTEIQMELEKAKNMIRFMNGEMPEVYKLEELQDEVDGAFEECGVTFRE